MRTNENKCTLDRAQYLVGQPVCVNPHTPANNLYIQLFRLERKIACSWTMEDGQLVIAPLPRGNYGIVVSGENFYWEGAFDVVASHRQAIRYGFLSDFDKSDRGSEAVNWLRDLHLNTAQFYDWMYRHDHLVPDEEVYSDPLGRTMCFTTVQQKIQACKAAGIRPFAYGAVYAATRETLQQHPDWGLYTMDGAPMDFAGWLYYMNISEKCGWSRHLLDEYCSAIHIGFQGIHMDTYGFPKWVWDRQGRPMDLSAEFPGLIDRAAQAVEIEDPNSGVIFNAVNNWPMEAVAPAAQDAVYIEVWPPNDSYRDLYTLIREARLHSGKPVVLAAYLKPLGGADAERAESAMRLCWAAISASGGTQLLFGEDKAALMDSYYANYAKLSPSMLPCVQKYCDFLVRYADLMYDDRGSDVTRTISGGINEDVCFSGSAEFSPEARGNAVWTIIRESRDRLSINLINLTGNDTAWNEPKVPPVPVQEIQIALRLDRPVCGVYAASPDGESLCATSLPFSHQCTERGRVYSVELPKLTYWSVVWIELEG